MLGQVVKMNVFNCWGEKIQTLINWAEPMTVSPSTQMTIFFAYWSAIDIRLCYTPRVSIIIHLDAASPRHVAEDERKTANGIWIGAIHGEAGWVAGGWYLRVRAWNNFILPCSHFKLFTLINRTGWMANSPRSPIAISIKHLLACCSGLCEAPRLSWSVGSIGFKVHIQCGATIKCNLMRNKWENTFSSSVRSIYSITGGGSWRKNRPALKVWAGKSKPGSTRQEPSQYPQALVLPSSSIGGKPDSSVWVGHQGLELFAYVEPISDAVVQPFQVMPLKLNGKMHSSES